MYYSHTVHQTFLNLRSVLFKEKRKPWVFILAGHVEVWLLKVAAATVAAEVTAVDVILGQLLPVCLKCLRHLNSSIHLSTTACHEDVCLFVCVLFK